MRPKDCAYIVEHLSVRFMAMVADHSRQLAEHRAAFGARTEADAKIIAGLRSEIVAARMAVLERDSLMSERDGLLTQVQDMRAEMQRLSKQLDWERAEIKRLQWENVTMHKDAEDGYTEAIKVLGDPIALSKERDALRAEIDFLKTLRPKYKVGDKLESYSSAVTIVGVRTVYDCQTDGAEYPVGHSEDELKERYEQTPKHPVKVGTWVRRLVPSPACDVGTVAKVVHVDDDTSEIEYDVKRIDGQHGVWFAKNCEPCDTPEATHAEPDLTQLHAKGKEAWSDVPNATQWVEEMRGNSEATHDTEAGKAAAESAVKTEPVAEEIKVGDMGEVFQATTRTLNSDVGITGCVSSIHLDPCHGGFLVKFDPSTQSRRSAGMQAFGLCDVRKVTT